MYGGTTDCPLFVVDASYNARDYFMSPQSGGRVSETTDPSFETVEKIQFGLIHLHG